MSKKLHARYLFRLSLLSTVILLLGAAFALLNGGSPSLPFDLPPHPAGAAQARFDDLSIVGPPSLPAATVNAILARLSSPMNGTGKVVEQVSQQTSIDDAFALAVWWTETNDGAAGVGLAYRNPGGVRDSVGYPSASNGYTIYPSYTDAIVYWFHMMRNMYVDRGLATVYAISHPYVGTSSSPLWAAKVIASMVRYRGEAPPPPLPTLVPSPTFSPYLPHHRPVVSTGTEAGAQRATSTAPSPHSQQGEPANTVQPAALSPGTTWVVVLFALVLALTIALLSVKFLPAVPVIDALTTALEADRPEALMGHSYIWADHSAQFPDTEKLVPLSDWETGSSRYAGMPSVEVPSTSPLRLPSRPISSSFTYAGVHASLFRHAPETPGTTKIRRTVLLPSRQDNEVTREQGGAVGEITKRPAGLLARYGQSQQE